MWFWGFPSLSKWIWSKLRLFSFLRQEITHRIIFEADRQHWSPLSRGVIDHVINEFGYLAPVANQCFRTLVIRIAFNVYLSQLLGEWFCFCHPTQVLALRTTRKIWIVSEKGSLQHFKKNNVKINGEDKCRHFFRPLHPNHRETVEKWSWKAWKGQSSSEIQFRSDC